jgi:hypothetical protein
MQRLKEGGESDSDGEIEDRSGSVRKFEPQKKMEQLMRRRGAIVMAKFE